MKIGRYKLTSECFYGKTQIEGSLDLQGLTTDGLIINRNELIEITHEQYGNNKLSDFFNQKEK